MSMPHRIKEKGEFEGKIRCTLYQCANNTGLMKCFPDSCCKLKNPMILDCGEGKWTCTNVRLNDNN